jgi:hypothetical protein
MKRHFVGCGQGTKRGSKPARNITMRAIAQPAHFRAKPKSGMGAANARVVHELVVMLWGWMQPEVDRGPRSQRQVGDDERAADADVPRHRADTSATTTRDRLDLHRPRELDRRPKVTARFATSRAVVAHGTPYQKREVSLADVMVRAPSPPRLSGFTAGDRLRWVEIRACPANDDPPGHYPIGTR